MGSGFFFSSFFLGLNFVISKGMQISQMFSHFLLIYILKFSKFFLLPQCEKLLPKKKKALKVLHDFSSIDKRVM
jgi:hypothetical protein